jgi:eukaryotic-like serine/threonine-protein kinase
METIVKAGRYEILGELGRGAMGIVYRAMDPVIGRPVAVKTIRLSEEGTGLSRPELLSRFQTEARAAGLLTHPNIVVVYDAGEENGLYYITMELVEGKSVQALLDGGHGFPVPRVLRIIEQTCNALQFAHDRNVVHRDIKPANLMLTNDDIVKVSDFGTAKILQFGTVQQTTNVMGTPSYMSPEQVKGRPVDGRSDIFSMGVMFYELLTGEKPFPGQSITTVIYKIVNEEPIPPRQLNPSIHPGLNEIVLRALAKEPEARYQSCREMLEDLRTYRTQGGGERNPDATLITPRFSASQLMGAGGFTRPAPTNETPTAATVRSLQNRTTNPSQTPALRRTGPVQPYVEPPKKSNALITVLLGLLLIAVIVYGGLKLRPEFQAARDRNNLTKSEAAPLPVAPVISAEIPTPVLIPDPSSIKAAPQPEQPAPPVEKASDPPVASTPVATTAVATRIVAPAKKIETSSAAVAEYKKQIEEALADHGWSDKVKLTAAGNSIALNGKLRPAEHSALLHLMRAAPQSVHIIDDILYDDTPLSDSGSANNEGHPVPAPDKSAVHVLTNVVGAKATLFGPTGRTVSSCATPCSFNNLAPAQYSIQIEKDGYVSVQTAIELKAGEADDKKFTLEVAGEVASEVVPESSQPAGRVAWAQIESTPSGAEIFVDGKSTGQVSPARVQIPVGAHLIALKRPGFWPARHFVEASDGGTVKVSEKLKIR